MRNSNLIFLLLGIVFCMSACQDLRSTDKQVIRIGEAFASPEELRISDSFNEIQYIPLETTDSCLIGSSPILYLVDDYILITTAQKQCLLFDKATGKFKRQIGHVGNDPGGYRSVDCIIDERNKRLLFYGWSHDLIGYDLEGHCLGKIEIPSVSDAYPESCFCLNKDTIIGYFQNIEGKDPNRMLYFKENKEEIALLPNERECPAFEINTIDVWKGEPAVKAFGLSALKGIMYMKGQDPETESVAYLANSCFWHVGNKTYLNESFNDTIFQVNGTTLTPALFFDKGELEWEYKDRFRKDKSKGIYISQVLDSERLLIGQAIIHLYDQDKRSTYNVLFDKASGITKVFPSDKGITDDLNGFLAIQPQTVYVSGEYGGLLTADQIRDRLDTYSGLTIPKPLEMLRDIQEEQNPVVVILR